ncbi:hypothetical protein DL764_010504 [Monosporascus ibericus]|uniref:RRM domain-containing protein n=1 Tax=Monosporascus ibericus TaxID=155417 RepID=A0A4Q4SU78_9PEZI|nr:hypothetical protein DL764_010504 [Monosporascus ibericus]
MSQSDVDQSGLEARVAPAPSAGQAVPPNQNQVPMLNGHEGIVNRKNNPSHPGIENVRGNGDAEGQEGNAAAVESEGQSPSVFAIAEEPIESQQNVSSATESTLNADASDTLTSHSELPTPSHDLAHDIFPSSNAQASSPAQPAPAPNLQAKQESSEEHLQDPVQKQSPDETQTASPTDVATIPLQQPTGTTAEAKGPSGNDADDPIDIQALVDTITANAAKEDASQTTAPHAAVTVAATTPSSSLPPRPPIPQQAAQSHVSADDSRAYQPGFPPTIPAALPHSIPAAPGTAYPAGAPGTTSDSHGALPPPPSASMNAPPSFAPPASHIGPTYSTVMGGQPQASTPSQQWETFQEDERRYVSEAKWDRFPENSRLFIGNLSSERVSKKEVFDIFSPYGRLAQISLKQAYGFVQYHTVQEGQAAMNNLQGIEIKGRKVHLEFSRPQRKDGDGEKQRGNRKDKRDGDRHDGARGKRDDYRPARQPSPRRSGHRQQNSYGSDRGHYDAYGGRRGRSRSPLHYVGRDSGGYRRRSPSPRRFHPSEAELDIPRRYGGSVPDVQFLLLQEVSRDFISWVERAFVSAGLRVEVMFLNPRFPRDAVIHRQVAEGVHAVSELDYRAQQIAKIPLQVFDRSAGQNSVRFDQYQDLDPNIAAQLVVRTKSSLQAVPPYAVQPTYNSQPTYGGYPGYAPAYAQPAQPQYVPPPYSNQPYPPANTGASHMDNHTLQQILGSIHNQQPASGQGMPTNPGVPVGAGALVDVNSVMAGYGHNPGAPLPPHGTGHGPGVPPAGSGDPAQHVQNIMAQLSRYRQ